MPDRLPPTPSSALLFAVLALSMVACGSPPGGGGAETSVAPSASSVPDLQALAAYDAGAPLNLGHESEPRVTDDGITIEDVAWDSPAGGRVSAWLVVPAGDGPFAGLVYLHGSETDRDDFLDEAIAMAHGGAVSVVMDAPFSRVGESRRNFLSNFGLAERERDMTAQALVDVRRAYDLLVARSDVDPQRLAFVGHSWGASLGMVLAAVDERPRSLVLVTGRPSWTGFLQTSDEPWVRAARDRVDPAQWADYLALMAPLDAMAQVHAVDGSRLYLQYGIVDEVVPADVSAELIEAADGARADLYDAAHALNDAATADRVAWLVERLGLQPIPAGVLAEVGLPDE